MITPFKAVIGPDYKTVEATLMRAVHIRAGLPPEPPAAVAGLIKRADRVAAYLEATQLAGFSEREARSFFGSPRIGRDVRIEPMPPDEAKRRYIDRFRILGGAAAR